jgi:hypothetical protein
MTVLGVELTIMMKHNRRSQKRIRHRKSPTKLIHSEVGEHRVRYCDAADALYHFRVSWRLESRIVLITERSLDTVACLGNSDLDDPREDCRGSDNLAAGDKGDLVAAAAR